MAKVENTIQPPQIAIEHAGNQVRVIIAANIEQISREAEDGRVTLLYQYDEYQILTMPRDNLAADVEANLQAWIDLAKAIEAQPRPMTDRERIVALEIENAALIEELLQLRGI
jgi:hypothetical protein